MSGFDYRWVEDLQRRGEAAAVANPAPRICPTCTFCQKPLGSSSEAVAIPCEKCRKLESDYAALEAETASFREQLRAQLVEAKNALREAQRNISARDAALRAEIDNEKRMNDILETSLQKETQTIAELHDEINRMKTDRTQLLTVIRSLEQETSTSDSSSSAGSTELFLARELSEAVAENKKLQGKLRKMECDLNDLKFLKRGKRVAQE